MARKAMRGSAGGSVTVEAAFLMPLAVMCVVFLLYIGFYWYDCAVCTGACYQASRLLAASDASFSLSEEQQLVKTRTIGLRSLQMTAHTSGSKTTVLITAELPIPLLGKTWTVDTKQSAYALDQRSFIMKCRLLLSGGAYEYRNQTGFGV